MWIKNKYIKKLFNLVYYVFILSCFVYGIGSITYANTSTKNPDVTITIAADGSHSSKGNLFGDELWYPGKEKKGFIRINNNFKAIKINNLGINVEIVNFAQGFDRDFVYASFLDNMKLTIIKDNIVFDDLIIDEESLGNLIKNNTFIGAGRTIDLEYKLKMDGAAGNELQNLTANIKFMMNAEENSSNHDDDNGDDSQLVNQSNNNIPDIDGHWAHDCIIALLDHDIIDLDENGSVRPDDYITRAETAELLARALGIEPQEKLFSGYLDSLPKKYRGYIIATSEAKIFRGYSAFPGRVFKANNYITREELSCVFIRAFEKKYEKEIVLGFLDKDEISDWALNDVEIGVVYNILKGYSDNTFRPQQKTTRAEAFTIVCKLLGYHDEHNKKK